MVHGLAMLLLDGMLGKTENTTADLVKTLLKGSLTSIVISNNPQ